MLQAFSDDPNAFVAGGFGISLEKTMRALYLKKVFLWPRFKKGVSETLDTKQPDVTQTFVEMTPYMAAIHTVLA